MRAIPVITAALIFLHLVILFGGRHVWGIPESFGRLFFMDQEYNIPTFYTSILFLGCAYFCIRHASVSFTLKRILNGLTWAFLSILLVFLAADEWFALHEQLIIPLRESFSIEGGVFYFSWTIAYILLLLVVGVITLPWLFRLESKLRNWLMLSAAVYIFGALGLEMYGSYVYSLEGFAYTERYANIVTWEESLELIGLTMALYTLATFLPRKKEVSSLPVAEQAVGTEVQEVGQRHV